MSSSNIIYLIPVTFTDVHCASKNDTDIAHYNCNAQQPIFVIFGRMLLSTHAIEW